MTSNPTDFKAPDDFGCEVPGVRALHIEEKRPGKKHLFGGVVAVIGTSAQCFCMRARRGNMFWGASLFRVFI